MALYSVLGNAQAGMKAALSARDRNIELTGTAGRVQRAMNNHFEGLILFGIAATVIAVSGQSTSFTAACAWVYLARGCFTSRPMPMASCRGGASSGARAGSPLS
jgi:uncharacterized MAPEG superfamily protein